MHTKVSVQHVDFSLFNRMHLEGLMVEDQKGDTLLFAGDARVRITDWFFFKKHIELKYIGLENALVKFQRTDSVWSQQFLFDYFSSPPSATPKKKGGMQLDLKRLELKNVVFVKRDAWLGEDLTLKVGSLNLNADQLSLSGNKYRINSLLVTGPVVAIYKYNGLKPKSLLSTDDDNSPNDSWNNGSTIFQIGDLKISNGTLKIDKENGRQPLAWFDGQHILFTDINAEFNNSDFTGDTILSKLKLNAKERSGLEVKSLIADVKMTPKEMAFDNLEIKTNNSTIRNYYRMSYADLSSMDDFIHAVNLQGNFENSEIDSDDIAFFAPGMKKWKKKIILNGKVRGTVDAIAGREMVIRAGNSTLLNGDINLTGLPDIYQTFIDFKANDFRTTYGDAVTIVPAMRRVTIPDLRKIQYVNFKGNFTGFLRDFVTFGTITTNLGVVKTDLNMKLPKGKVPLYSGSIATDNFRLGEFLDNKDIGAVSFSAVVKGSGFNAKTQKHNLRREGSIRGL